MKNKLAIMTLLSLVSGLSYAQVETTTAWGYATGQDMKSYTAGFEQNNGKKIATVERKLAGDVNAPLDVSFGTDGKVQIPVGVESYLTEIHLLPEGKIELKGYYAATQGTQDVRFRADRKPFEAHLNSDGSFDTNFGDNGIETEKIETSIEKLL